MRPFVPSGRAYPHGARLPRGYTLVEILVATALTLIMMGAVVQIFGEIGQSVNDSRATLEISDRLRAASARLQLDLAGVTVVPLPPREIGDGYLEIIEGPAGPAFPPSDVAWNTDLDQPDPTVGDFDDILMFTAHSYGRPFVGRCRNAADLTGTLESDTAEIMWFLRGRTLYRRVLLVAPGAQSLIDGSNNAGNRNGVIDEAELPDDRSFYHEHDLSVRRVANGWMLNSLADLARRENRYAHRTDVFPFDVRGWGQLRLPLLCECAHPDWDAGNVAPVAVTFDPPIIDFWINPHPWQEVHSRLGALNRYYDPDELDHRVGEDVILTDVIGFDVKVWDPTAPAGGGALGAYVDLGWQDRPWRHRASQQDGPADRSVPSFQHNGHPRSGLAAPPDAAPTDVDGARVYDTWTLHYEHDGRDQDQAVDGGAGTDQASNGFDDNGVGGIDDCTERETWAPYPVPLRGIQVKIRVFEPDSRQIREITVVQDFLPK